MIGIGTHEDILRVVRRIPRGRVATYGQVAELAGRPAQPRLVGYALSALPEKSRVPWHRVVNARGEVSLRAEPGAESEQRQRLEAEGVVFNAQGRLSLEERRWRPRVKAGRDRGRR